MRNKKSILIYVILTILTVILFLPHADARIVCTKSEKNNLKNKAYKATLSYDFKKNDKGEHYFEVIIDNIEEGIEVKINNSSLGSGDKNGKIVIGEYFSDGEEIVVDFYAAYGEACVGQKLYSKKLTLPKYNVYSEYEECIEYEEFALCNRWYKGDIPNYDYFRTKLDDYIKALNEKNRKTEPVIEKENDNKILFYVLYFLIIVSIGGGVYVIAHRTKHRKIKKEINESNKDVLITDEDVNKNVGPNILNHKIETKNKKNNKK
jgi:hypothetical protein